jgi:hypothetical protein
VVADVEGEDLAGSGVHRNPPPVPVRLRTDKPPALVSFGLQPVQAHRRGAAGRLAMERLEGRRKLFDPQR